MFLRVVGESLNQTEQIALGCFEISGCWLIINFLVYFALGGLPKGENMITIVTIS